MFKIGEKIVCVNSGNISDGPRPNIKNGNIYTVKYHTYLQQSFFVTIDGEYQEEKFFANRFISLKEYRKQKLEKLQCLK